MSNLEALPASGDVTAKAEFWRQWGIDGMPKDKQRLAEAAWSAAAAVPHQVATEPQPQSRADMIALVKQARAELAKINCILASLYAAGDDGDALINVRAENAEDELRDLRGKIQSARDLARQWRDRSSLVMSQIENDDDDERFAVAGCLGVSANELRAILDGEES